MDLSTKYMGLNLRTPLVVSASPLSENLDNIRRMEDVGASGVVIYSLFEEQITSDRLELHHHMTYGTDSYAEALTYFPEPSEFHLGPEGYLNHIRKAKEAVKPAEPPKPAGWDGACWPISISTVTAVPETDTISMDLPRVS